MLKRSAFVFAIVFIAVGLLGFMDPVAPLREDGFRYLLGLFAVNTAHNVVHLASGGVALVAGLRGEAASAVFFRAFGLVYALVAVAGLFVGHGTLAGLAHNPADSALHAVIAIGALYLGFRAPISRHPA